MSYRIADWIKPTMKTGFPHVLFFIDTECFVIENDKDNVEFPFKLVCCQLVVLDNDANVLSNEAKHFTDLQQFYSYFEKLAKKHKSINVYGHNIGFDLRVLQIFEWSHKNDYDSEPPIINERVFIWKIKAEKSKILFLDTANFGVTTVKDLGKRLGKEKIEIDLINAPMETLIEYCENDVEIVKLFTLEYIRFCHSNDLGMYRMTLASQSLAAWRHKFMSHSVKLHTIKEALDLERKSYRGGRVECHFIGKATGETFYNLDINSMYPFIMKESKLPYELISISDDMQIPYLKARTFQYYCIADVTLRTSIPAYPYTYKGRLVFPTGKFRTVLNNSELRFAIKHDHIIKVHKTQIYKKDYLFADYVSFFYSNKLSAKLTGNSSWEYINKLFLNSLYGKFGQTDMTREITEFPGNDEIWRMPYINMSTHEHGQFVSWYDKVLVELKSGETSTSFPAIASAVTAEARMLLFEYMMEAGLENVYYCDTDSIICNSTGFLKLQNRLSETEIGLLKMVSTSQQIEIRNPKDYSFGEKNRTKGIKSNAVLTTEGKYRQLQFQSFLAWLNLGGKGAPLGRYVDKGLSLNYKKGIVDMETGRVKPFVLK